MASGARPAVATHDCFATQGNTQAKPLQNSAGAHTVAQEAAARVEERAWAEAVRVPAAVAMAPEVGVTACAVHRFYGRG